MRIITSLMSCLLALAGCDEKPSVTTIHHSSANGVDKGRKSLFGRRVGWFVALLAAANPFLNYYGREARMYSMVAFFAVLCTACYLHVYGFGRRR